MDDIYTVIEKINRFTSCDYGEQSRYYTELCTLFDYSEYYIEKSLKKQMEKELRSILKYYEKRFEIKCQETTTSHTEYYLEEKEGV